MRTVKLGGTAGAAVQHNQTENSAQRQTQVDRFKNALKDKLPPLTTRLSNDRRCSTRTSQAFDAHPAGILEELQHFGVNDIIQGKDGKLTRDDLDRLNDYLARLPVLLRADLSNLIAETLSELISPFDFSANPHPTTQELQQGMAAFIEDWKAPHGRVATGFKKFMGQEDKFDAAIHNIIDQHCADRDTLANAMTDLFATYGTQAFSLNTTEGKQISSKFLAIAALALALNPAQRIVASQSEAGNAILAAADFSTEERSDSSIPELDSLTIAAQPPVNAGLAALLDETPPSSPDSVKTPPVNSAADTEHQPIYDHDAGRRLTLVADQFSAVALAWQARQPKNGGESSSQT